MSRPSQTTTVLTHTRMLAYKSPGRPNRPTFFATAPHGLVTGPPTLVSKPCRPSHLGGCGPANQRTCHRPRGSPPNRGSVLRWSVSRSTQLPAPPSRKTHNVTASTGLGSVSTRQSSSAWFVGSSRSVGSCEPPAPRGHQPHPKTFGPVQLWQVCRTVVTLYLCGGR